MAEAGGRAEDRPSSGAHDPGGDVEHEVAKRLGRAPERRVVGRLAGRACGGAEIAAERGQVERQQRGGEPDAVGVLVAGWQMPERLAEL